MRNPRPSKFHQRPLTFPRPLRSYKLIIWGSTFATCLSLNIAAPASAVVVHADGHRYGVTSRKSTITSATAHASRSLTPFAITPSSSSSDNLTYHGGPVMHSFNTHAIYWDPSNTFTSTTEGLISQYFAGVAHDSGLGTNVYSVNAQYTDSTSSAIYNSSFGGAQIDNNGYPASGCDVNTRGITSESYCLSDSQPRFPGEPVQPLRHVSK